VDYQGLLIAPLLLLVMLWTVLCGLVIYGLLLGRVDDELEEYGPFPDDAEWQGQVAGPRKWHPWTWGCLFLAWPLWIAVYVSEWRKRRRKAKKEAVS
jgi:hypothetical protein